MKRKNPYIGEEFKGLANQFKAKSVKTLFPNAKITFLYEGGYSEETYLIKLNSDTFLEKYNITLSKGQYIVKYGIFNTTQIKMLNLFSKLDLIPPIYIVTKSFYIMKFIVGVNLQNYLDLHKPGPGLKKYLIEKISKEFFKWRVNNFIHGDIASRNVLLSISGKIYLIDPSLIFYQDNWSEYTKLHRNHYREDDIKNLNLVLSEIKNS